ncbi:MAG TPA: GAF domain-containing protein [Polyangiaceae bacterium]|nr:GAF domain-containing protein [Polyangiaceae bacterium]
MDISPRILDIVRQAPNAEEGARLALEAILEATHTGSGTVHLMAAGETVMKLFASKNIPPFVLEKVQLIPVGKGMGGVAVEKRQPVTTCNLQTDDAGGVIRQGARETGVQGALAVPMIHGDDAIGALGVATQMPRDFTRVEIDEILAMGSALGRALREKADQFFTERR